MEWGELRLRQKHSVPSLARDGWMLQQKVSWKEYEIPSSLAVSCRNSTMDSMGESASVLLVLHAFWFIMPDTVMTSHHKLFLWGHPHLP